MRCVKCGGQKFRDEEHDHRITFGRQTFVAPVAGSKCTACGEVTVGSEALGRWEEAMTRALALVGRPSGKGLAWLRQKAALRAVDLGALLDVDAVSVSRWENEKMGFDRATWVAVCQLALEHLDGSATLRGRLSQLGGPAPKQVRAQDVVARSRLPDEVRPANARPAPAALRVAERPTARERRSGRIARR